MLCASIATPLQFSAKISTYTFSRVFRTSEGTMRDNLLAHEIRHRFEYSRTTFKHYYVWSKCLGSHLHETSLDFSKLTFYFCVVSRKRIPHHHGSLVIKTREDPYFDELKTDFVGVRDTTRVHFLFSCRCAFPFRTHEQNTKIALRYILTNLSVSKLAVHCNSNEALHTRSVTVWIDTSHCVR